MVSRLAVDYQTIEEEYTRVVLGFEPTLHIGGGIKGGEPVDTYALENQGIGLRMKSGRVLPIDSIDNKNIHALRTSPEQAYRLDSYRIFDNIMEAVVDGMAYTFLGDRWLASLAPVSVEAMVVDYGMDDALKAVIVAAKIVYFQHRNKPLTHLELPAKIDEVDITIGVNDEALVGGEVG